jgi:hypothetical protein
MSYKNIYKEWLKTPFDEDTIQATRESYLKMKMS